MSREAHVRFCESGRGKFPPATRLRQGERVRFAFIHAEKAVWPIDVLCTVATLAPRFRTRPASSTFTDVTYVWTLQGRLYLAVMVDLFSRRVVGWDVSEHNDRELALGALAKAICARKPAAGSLHQRCCGSFFATTKGEMNDHEIYQTRAEEKKAIADYIEGFYNPVRRHLAIGFVSPIEFDLNDMIGKSAA
jgi:transposase InsO family protein